MQGDADDRDKIRRKVIEDQKRKEAEEAVDRMMLDIDDMARNVRNLG